jgi:hypothetical protein
MENFVIKHFNQSSFCQLANISAKVLDDLKSNFIEKLLYYFMLFYKQAVGIGKLRRKMHVL